MDDDDGGFNLPRSTVGGLRSLGGQNLNSDAGGSRLYVLIVCSFPFSGVVRVFFDVVDRASLFKADQSQTESLGGNSSLQYKPMKQNLSKEKELPQTVASAAPAAAPAKSGLQLVHASPIQLFQLYFQYVCCCCCLVFETLL